MTDIHVVILAAGKGTRMKSQLPKVLHRIAGLTVIEHVVRIATSLTPASITLVVGHGAEEVKRSLSGRATLQFVTQEQQLGTGHALLQTRSVLDGKSGTVVLLSGGASAGAKDLVVDAVRALGGELLFHGVRVKPGKPLLAAKLGAHLFVAPLVRRLARLPDVEPRVVEATLAADVKSEGERFLFLPVHLDAGRAVPVFKGSGALTSMAASDGWIGVPEGASLAAGARVRVTLW